MPPGKGTSMSEQTVKKAVIFDGEVLAFRVRKDELYARVEDVARMLGYADYEDLLQLVASAPEEFHGKIGHLNVVSSDGEHRSGTISLRGVFRAMMLSEAPGAARFRAWILTILPGVGPLEEALEGKWMETPDPETGAVPNPETGAEVASDADGYAPDGSAEVLLLNGHGVKLVAMMGRTPICSQFRDWAEGVLCEHVTT